MRWRLRRFLIPIALGLCLVMIPLNRWLESEHVEVFPFFKWKLFAHVPDWETVEYGLAIEAVDGEPAPGPGMHWLIPSDDVRDRKALRLAAAACTKDGDCDGAVTEVLVSRIQDAFGDRSVDFRIVQAKVDLRDIGGRVADIADGTVALSDFLRPIKVIGRWNTRTGRLGTVPAASASD